MNVKLIKLTDGSIYVAKMEPDTASQDPLTEKEMVILDLYSQLEELTKKLNSIPKHKSNLEPL